MIKSPLGEGDELLDGLIPESGLSKPRFVAVSVFVWARADAAWDLDDEASGTRAGCFGFRLLTPPAEGEWKFI